MQRITPIAQNHQVILEGLKVLRLIADRVKAGDAVEPDDIGTVLHFLRNVGCECLDHTASLILQPALERARERVDAQRLRAAIACHRTVRPLLDETACDLEYFKRFFVHHPDPLTNPVDDVTIEEDEILFDDFIHEPEEEFPGCFLLHSHLLTKLVEDLILEEDDAFLKNAADLLVDPEGRRKIEEFDDQEGRISAIAMEQSPTLHLLEAKYDRGTHGGLKAFAVNPAV